MSEPDNKQKRATARDVARRAGVSVATVSRVLNSPQSVADATRDAVNEAIASLSFRRSPAARAINSGRTRIVAALIPTIDHSIFARFLDGLESELTAHGLSLIVTTTDDDPEIEAQKAQELLDIGAEGFVVSGLAHTTGFFDLIRTHDIPAVSISLFDANGALPTIGYDNKKAATKAYEHLQDLGHTNVAVIHGPSANNDRTRQRISTLMALAPAGTLGLFETDISLLGGRDATRRVLADATKYTACLCLSDVLSLGAIIELQANGCGVPDDLSVCGMEGLDLGQHLSPSLTTVTLPVYEMGQNAGRAIALWLNEQTRPAPKELPIGLRHGQSTGPVAKSET